MQTFLPVADFARRAPGCWTRPRLGKQRVETLQILRAIELPDYGWANHPAVTMWRGRTPALVAYGLAMVAGLAGARLRRQHARPRSPSSPPSVVGRPQAGARRRRAAAVVARGRRSCTGRTGRTCWPRTRTSTGRGSPSCSGPSPTTCPTSGRGPDDVPPDPAPPGVRRCGSSGRGRTTSWAPAWPPAWSGWARSRGSTSTPPVSRPPSCGRCRRSCPDAARPRTSASCRRSSTRSRPGDPVALPIEHGAGLLLGEVIGDYRFEGRELLPHRRPARWDRRRARGRPPARPATLQDPRALFSVVLDPAAVGGWVSSAAELRAAARSAAAPGRGRRSCRRRRG